MLAIIIVIAAIVLIKFFVANNKQSTQILKEGGMEQKYRQLIAFIMSGDSRTQIFQRENNMLGIAVKSVGGVTIFFLTQTFGHLTVEWKMESPVYGKHKLKWEFPEFTDQDIMAGKISNDLQKYQTNIVTK